MKKKKFALAQRQRLSARVQLNDERAGDGASALSDGYCEGKMRDLAFMTSTGWVRSLLLAIMVLLGSCLLEGVEMTFYPSRLTIEPAPSTRPSQIVAQPEITPAWGEGKMGAVKITVVYDNIPYDPRLQPAWGFACQIETGEKTILFDTGGDGDRLLRNMATLGADPKSIEVIVLSHIHGDHTGGLESVLGTGAHPTVYLPRSFPSDFKSRVRAQADVVEVGGATKIADGVYTTGEMGSDIIEQALVLKTGQGLVVVTGCAHPGISEMVRRAVEMGGDEVYLVMGGFHLGGASESRIKEIAAEFQRLGVKKVAPSHCTGDNAIRLFREVYGEDFVESGAGRVIEVGP
jgi:7,8-dihydropterin-6-yl-methyl-4-(beta-D-ribofuranosyl)aminobenzene 5'-phosphate synthase